MSFCNDLQELLTEINFFSIRQCPSQQYLMQLMSNHSYAYSVFLYQLHTYYRCILYFYINHTHIIGVWKAVKDVLKVPVRGCNFHWQQAVLRKVGEIGLKRDYEKKEDIYKFIRKLMALPFLPAEHIVPSFEHLEQTVSAPSLLELCTYIHDTWLTSSVWSVESWCQFMQPIRTNNDVEGWHRKLSALCNSNAPPFYALVQLLFNSVKSMSIEIRMLSHGKLVRKQKKKYRLIQGKIFELWAKYNSHNLTTSKLLKSVSYLL